MPLNREQFKIIQQEAESIIKFSRRKEAIILARQMETQITDLATNNPELLHYAKKLLAKLKWVACPLIKDDQEFFKLFREGLLEGLELTDFNDLVSERLALQFEINLEETVRGLLLAVRENNQNIGINPIMVKNESRLVRPLVRHWLIDFLRNLASESPTKVDEANYLFNNTNAKALPETDRQTLGNVLSFYDTFRLIDRELARRERETLVIPQTEGTEQSATAIEVNQPSVSPFISPAAPPILIKKSIRLATQENKEILNQLLTDAPIKIAEFEQPAKPTIKNWLADYMKQKGVGRHEPMERDNYLLNSPNVKILNGQERAKLTEILNSYDNDSEVPISPTTKLIALEGLGQKETPGHPLVSTAPRPPRQFVPPPPLPSRTDTYREPVAQEDLAGPQKPSPRPAPRIEGNIVDLKDWGDK